MLDRIKQFSSKVIILKYFNHLTQYGIFLTFLFAPIWLKWSDAPPPFSSTYVTGFVIVAIMSLTIISWLISGFHGWRSLIQTHWHIAWCICLGIIVFWGVISQFWAFGLEQYPGMAQSAALQLVIVAVFSLVVLAAAPSPNLILGVFILSMLIQGYIGGLQVVFQSDIDLGWLGELSLDVSKSGVSVLESNGERWLRPYGLLPHPNVLAGIIVLGLMASAAWILDAGKKRLLGSIAFIIGFWFLLLTFSRGAWLGFIVGMLFALPFVIRQEKFWSKLLPVIIGTVVTGIIFMLIFQPLLLSRAGLGTQNTELRSVADRIVFTEIAIEATQTHSFSGVGIGNFPWYASNYIFFRTDYDLEGNNVHNIYLTMSSELGLFGFVIFMAMMVSGIGATLKKHNTSRIALLAGFIAWAAIGLFDHYMWTLVMTQVLWLGSISVAMSGTTESSPNKG